MLGVVFFVLPGLFGFLLWNAYRTNRARSAEGRGYTPPAGTMRWEQGDTDDAQE